jgi:protein-disulfide isomerase
VKISTAVVLAALLLVLPSAVFAGSPSVEVVVFRSGGCGSWREAVSIVKAAARELVIKTKVRVVKVRDIDEARRLGFHGSPSVVVEGTDVEGPEVAARPASYG